MVIIFYIKIITKCKTRDVMKENKSFSTAVRLNERQVEVLDKMVEQGLAKTRSAAIHYLINKQQIVG